MNEKATKITLVKRSEYGWYSRDIPYNPDDELLILETYFGSCIRYNAYNFMYIRNLVYEGHAGLEPVGAELIDGKFHLFHYYIENLKEPKITADDLLELVKKWFELTSAGVNKIIITNDNGKFSIETE